MSFMLTKNKLAFKSHCLGCAVFAEVKILNMPFSVSMSRTLIVPSVKFQGGGKNPSFPSCLGNAPALCSDNELESWLRREARS